MRGRDIAVNTLLGVFLVAAFLLPFLLLVAVAEYIVPLASHWARNLFPAIVRPESAFFSFCLCVWALGGGIAGIRKRDWRSAFVFFAFLPMLLSMWRVPAHSLLAVDGAFFPWLLFLIIPAQTDLTQLREKLTHFEFFVGAGIAGTVVAINTGMLGSGVVSHTASECVLAVLFGVSLWWMIRLVIANRVSSSSPSSASPASL